MAMIDRIFDKGSLQALERVTQFTNARGRVLADNIANIDTPRFKPKDLSVGDFQATLKGAIADRRKSHTPMTGRLQMQDSWELAFGEDGLTKVRPQEAGHGILFHDQNNRDLERTMQHLAENVLAHNTAVQLIRQEMSVITMAIRERV